VISYRAHYRKAVRLERRDQIRREIREGVELLARCEAGDPEALRQVEESRRRLLEAAEVPDDYPEVVWPVPRRPHRRGFFAAMRRRFFAAAADRYDPEPEPEPDGLEPDDLGPRHALRPGESERQYRRRMGRPDLAERRAARLLARAYWDRDRPLPGAVREALYALSMSPRELRRELCAIWERGGLARRDDGKIRGIREQAAYWTASPLELPPRSGPGKAAHWLEVCLHTGPPAGAAAVGIALPDCTGGAVVVP
jgi:hypothetical protein